MAADSKTTKVDIKAPLIKKDPSGYARDEMLLDAVTRTFYGKAYDVCLGSPQVMVAAKHMGKSYVIHIHKGIDKISNPALIKKGKGRKHEDLIASIVNHAKETYKLDVQVVKEN